MRHRHKLTGGLRRPQNNVGKCQISKQLALPHQLVDPGAIVFAQMGANENGDCLCVHTLRVIVSPPAVTIEESTRA